MVASGLGKGSYFISLDWVRTRLTELMGAPPFQGTLNLRIAKESREKLFSRRMQFAPVSTPGAAVCSGYLVAGNLISSSGQPLQVWAILPEVTAHSDILEIVSQYSVREQTSLSDGDRVTIEIDLQEEL